MSNFEQRYNDPKKEINYKMKAYNFLEETKSIMSKAEQGNISWEAAYANILQEKQAKKEVS